MKYMIEFNLPDNDTVLREIKTADVAWGIWGYRGYTKAKPVQKWIPCSERCPEHRIYVLVTYRPVYGLPDIGITYYDGNKWDAPKDGTPRKIIAWMPLPKPYCYDAVE